MLNKLTPEFAIKRREICNQCPSYNTEKNKCNECGCNITAKTLVPLSHCPLNKWNK